MNVATQTLEWYEHEDFLLNYKYELHERFHNNEYEITKYLHRLFNISNYETKRYFEHGKYVEFETCKKVYEYIKDNLDNFIKRYSHYYVGDTCLESVEFGEQEEQLTGIFNVRTGKEYNVKYLRSLFRKHDFYVSGNYAYYNLDGGFYVDLRYCKNQINNILNS